MGRLQAQIDAVEAAQARVYNSDNLNPRAMKGYNNAAVAASDAFRQAARSSGMLEVSQSKVTSQTQAYTKALQKQKLTFGEMRKNMKVMKAAYNEQLRMQQMTVSSMYDDKAGKHMVDITVPKAATADMDTLGNKIGWVSSQLKSGGQQMIDWGKNTQWAGRQLMVGFTLPVAIAGAAAGKMAYDVDNQLTRIEKVYDTSVSTLISKNAQMAQSEAQLAQVRKDAMVTAVNAAKMYGATAQESLGVQAELAATGIRGNALQNQTNEVLRIATLGEMDYQDAMNASISLQQVFRQSQQEMTESFNYMNGVENATSLSLQDFATAIPIAAAPIKEMGGDVKDLGVLLTAMKSRGIAASEGANAIKSSMQRLLRPSAQIQDEFNQLTGQSITKLVEDSKGELIPTMTAIAHSIEGLNKIDKGKVLSGLFGTYQRTRMGAMLEGMIDLENGVGQVSAAAEVGKMSVEDLAASADFELEKAANSISGRFKRAKATIMVEMAEMGKPFLQWATLLLEGASKILGAFNSLPSGAKNFMSLIAIIGALVGPIVMLTGLTANFAGQFIKGGAAIGGMLTKFKLLDKESTVAAKLAELAATNEQKFGSSMAQAAKQADILTDALNKAAMAHARVLDAQQISLNPEVAPPADTRTASQRMADRMRRGVNAAPAPTVLSRQPDTASGRMAERMRRGQGLATNGIAQNAAAMQVAEDAAEGTEQATRGMSKNAKLAAVDGALFAAAMGTSMVSSNETVDNVANFAMIVAGVAPLVSGLGAGLKNVKWATLGEKISGGFTTATTKARGLRTAMVNNVRSAGGFRGALVKGGVALAGMLGPMGLLAVGLGAAAGAGYLLYRHMKKAREQTERMYGDASGWAKIFDYKETEVAAGSQKQAQAFQKNKELVEQVKKEYKGVVEQIKEARTEAQKLRIAQDQGLAILASGGSASDAKRAVNALLEAAGDADLKVKVEMDFADADKTIADFQTSARERLSDLSNKRGKLETAQADGGGETIQFLNSKDRDAARLGGEQAGKSYANAFARAAEGGNQSVMVNAVRSFANSTETLMERAGNQNASAYSRAMNAKLLNSTVMSFLDQQPGLSGDIEKQKQLLSLYKSSGSEYQLLVASGVKLSREQEISLLTAEQNNGALKNTSALANGLNAIQLVQRRNRLAQLQAEKAQQGETSKTSRKEQEKANILAEQKELRKDGGAVEKAYENFDTVGAMKTAWQNVTSTIGEQIGQDLESKQKARMDRIEADGQARLDALDAEGDRMEEKFDKRKERMENRHEKETKRFDKRWENRKDIVNKAYDTQISRIEAQIAAEEKADETRQKIFEREQTRLQRLAEMATTNVDFNVALNKGDLDEAARIQIGDQARTAQWGIEDENTNAGDASAAKVEGLNNKKDSVEKSRDARLAAMDAVEEREKEALDRRQKREQKALENDQKSFNKRMESRRKLAQVDMENAKKAADFRSAKETASYQKGLALLNSYIPTSRADLKKHMDRLGIDYDGFGAGMTTKGRDWSKAIGDSLTHEVAIARNSLQNDVNWAAIGKFAANEMASGAFGLSLAEFNELMGFGKAPKATNKGKPKNGRGRRPDEGKGNVSGRHTGGSAMTFTGRTGFSASAGLFKQEQLTNIRNDEYVVDHRTHRALGTDYFENLRNGVRKGQPPATDGPGTTPKYGTGGGFGGFPAVMAALVAKGMAGMAGAFVQAGARGEAGTGTPGNFSTASAGKYGDETFSGEQLKNASIIASVGKRLGASVRDIKIALMTAMVESNLRNVNYGDRDSLGLFQQRAPWGSAKARTTPEKSAAMFFKGGRGGQPGLFDKKNREEMSMGEAAQAVQVSAFPGRYATKKNEADAIYAAMKFISKDQKGTKLPGFGPGLAALQGQGDAAADAAGGATYVGGKGGWHLPAKGKKVGNTHSPGPGSDISVGTGTPVYAAYDGVVAQSRDIGPQAGRRNSNGYGSYGRVIVLAHKFASGKTGYSLYAHNSQRLVSKGDQVPGGSKIALSGNTGNSSGPHLHFEIGYGSVGKAANPGSFLKARGLPAMKKGGEVKYDNTIANLHKDETVLTAELSSKLRDGIENIASGGGNVYHSNIDVHPTPGMDVTALAEEVVRIQKREERRYGQKR